MQTKTKIDPVSHSLIVLEFAKIRERLAAKCVTTTAQKRALQLSPLADIEKILLRQELTAEIRDLLAISGQPELAGLSDVGEYITVADKEGVLSEEALWQVAQLSKASTALLRIAQDRNRYPRLRGILDGLHDTSAVHSNVKKFIDPPGIFREDASEKLMQLRIAKKEVHDRLQTRLQNMIIDEKTAELWQEPLVTIRNDRFVLPLKVEHKSRVPSVIHDRSASGATLFVEPIEIIPVNNQLREIELEEKAEKLRILRNLSGIVGSYAQHLAENLSLLCELDFYVAAAHFADEIRGNFVTVEENCPLELIGARHPSLIFEKGFEKVVPLDFELKPSVRCVVITGPNMGGKTVALKTIGLCCIMASCGLAIPAEKRTILPFYRKFFADIGDEQSVEQSISSFASHIIHYDNAAQFADDTSLVLFDELGSATDPHEGMPISWALLEHIVSNGATVVANTHLGGLLGLAAIHDNCENAAMEFDTSKMQPTYRLITGIPGKSFAIEIAQMLGFSQKILSRAHELIEGGTTLDAVIIQLQARLAENDRLREKLQSHEKDVFAKKQILEGLIEANTKKEKEVERARRSYDDIYDSRLAAALRRELSQIEADWKKILETQSPTPKIQQKADEFLTNLKKRLKSADETLSQKQGLPKKLSCGEKVFVYRLHKWGEVLDETDETGFTRVLVGNLPLRLHSSGVDTQSEFERKRERQNESNSAKPQFAPRELPQQIDVRGMQREEAWRTIELAFDDACAAGAEKLRIVHGKGTGVLRAFVRQKCSESTRIAKIEVPPENEGGDGATVIYFSSAK